MKALGWPGIGPSKECPGEVKKGTNITGGIYIYKKTSDGRGDNPPARNRRASGAFHGADGET